MKRALTDEEAVISSLLVRGQSIEEITYLKPYMFSDRLLGKAYEIFLESFKNGKYEDYTSIGGKLSDIEGVPTSIINDRFTELLVSGVSTSAMIGRYAENVVIAYKQRRAKDLVEKASFSFGGVDSEISELTEELAALQELTSTKVGKTVAEMAKFYKDDYPKEPGQQGISLGFRKLDDTLGGIEGGDLCYIGARPSVGKSAFVNQIARNLGRKNLRVGFFSLEMQERNIYERFLANESRIGMGRIRSGQDIQVYEEEGLVKANERLQRVEQIIIYTGSFTATDIRQIVKRDRLEVVIVDYVQLILPEGRYRGNRTAEVGEISHKLKAVAMDFNIPMILLVQLNRAVEMRDTKEPTLADIRESGDIEQDASQVIFLWNKADSNSSDKSQKGCCVAKNRNGKLGRVDMVFKGELMRFVIPGDEDEADDDGEDAFVPLSECNAEDMVLPFV